MLEAQIILNKTGQQGEKSSWASSRPLAGFISGDLQMCNEKWLSVKDYEGMYEISNKGNVRSLKRNKPHILSPSTEKNNSGRKTVCLWKNGKEKRHKIHHLVLFAFVGSCPYGLETCHNDGNASDNCISNLRWDTHISNCQDRKKHGKEKGLFVKGNVGSPKINIKDVKRIRKIGRTQTLKDIALKYPVGYTQISNILLGYCWKNI